MMCLSELTRKEVDIAARVTLRTRLPRTLTRSPVFAIRARFVAVCFVVVGTVTVATNVMLAVVTELLQRDKFILHTRMHQSTVAALG